NRAPGRGAGAHLLDTPRGGGVRSCRLGRPADRVAGTDRPLGRHPSPRPGCRIRAWKARATDPFSKQRTNCPRILVPGSVPRTALEPLTLCLDKPSVLPNSPRILSTPIPHADPTGLASVDVFTLLL